MRLIGFSLTLFIIFWSTFWWIASQKLETSVRNWFDQKNPMLTKNFKKISTEGYPNRADIDIEHFHLTDNEKFSISAELIQILSLIYNNKHFITVFKPPIEIKHNTSFLTVRYDHNQ